jgi:hypothetical protein
MPGYVVAAAVHRHSIELSVACAMLFGELRCSSCCFN